MRKLLFLILILLPTLVFADRKKNKQLKLPISRWREVKRMKPDSTNIPSLFSSTSVVGLFTRI